MLFQVSRREMSALVFAMCTNAGSKPAAPHHALSFFEASGLFGNRRRIHDFRRCQMSGEAFENHVRRGLESL